MSRRRPKSIPFNGDSTPFAIAVNANNYYIIRRTHNCDLVLSASEKVNALWREWPFNFCVLLLSIWKIHICHPDTHIDHSDNADNRLIENMRRWRIFYYFQTQFIIAEYFLSFGKHNSINESKNNSGAEVACTRYESKQNSFILFSSSFTRWLRNNSFCRFDRVMVY